MLAADAYLLGAGDQLHIKVSDLRAGTGEAYQWLAFTGEFTVAPSGRIALPIVGELDAAGRTTSDLSADIARTLQAKAGLAAKPDAAVEIFKFRPFYVTGSVDKPGEYEFRPQLTVLQAISIAGGLQRVSGDALIGYVREALMAKGDLRELTSDRVGLMARQARLEAEIDAADAIRWPQDIEEHTRDPFTARMMSEQQKLFETRRSGLQAQIATLEASKAALQDEIRTLGEKQETNGRQLQAMSRELDQVTALVSKGLTVLPRQLEVAQATTQLQSNQLDAQIAVVRAKEDMTKADRDILDLKTTRRSDALQELADVCTKLAETNARIEKAQNLILHAEVYAPAAMIGNLDALAKPQLFIARRSDTGRVETLPAREEDLLQPGDVVRVVPGASDGSLTALQTPTGTIRKPPE